MRSKRILSFFICLMLLFGTHMPSAYAEEPLYKTAIENIAAKCADGDITEDINFIWFLADMMAYRELYPESESFLSDEKLEKCRTALLDFASGAESGADLAKSIIGFRALGYDADKIYKSDTERLEIVEKLAALTDNKSKSVTNIYTLPYAAIAMRDYATEEQSAYLLDRMLKQKAKWQDMSLGTDAAAPMILALSPYYQSNEEVKAAIDETVPLIKATQGESGLIGNAPSTGLVIAAFSAIGEETEFTVELTEALMDAATEGADAFYPIENSFGTEQGFRGLMAYELGKKGKSIFDFSEYPKNEFKAVSAESEAEHEPSGGSGGSSGGITVKNDEKVRVTVRIMQHDAGKCGNSYTYKKNSAAYTVLVSEKTEMDEDCTAYDATVKVLEENGISYTDRNGYIAEIGGLSEFDHGEFSGWMFMVNGVHQTVGSTYVRLTPDSTILWFYTDDYRYEKGSESFGYSGSKKEDKKEEAEAEDTKEEAAEEKTEQPAAAVEKAIADTAEYLLDAVSDPQPASIGGEWAVIGLLGSGAELPPEYLDKYYENLKKTVVGNNGILSARKYTEYARAVIALTLMDKNPEDVAGFDLVAPLYDFDTVSRQGINGSIWALIALDSGIYGSSAARSRYVREILDREIKTGGWSMSREDEAADCDVTAMALTALSAHRDEDGVAAAIERGISCLEKLQDADGGFSTYGEATAESIAQVITALSALGLDFESFTKNGKTPLDALSEYNNDGKGFSHTKGGETNLMATEQVLYALASLNKGRIFAADRKFLDVSENAKEISELAKRGILSGINGRTFAPDKTVTRAEFATVAVKALGLEEVGDSRFSDVSEDAWFYSYVGAAYRSGIVYGKSETEFDPYGEITCEEATAMLERTARKLGITASYEGAFEGEISEWAINSFAFCRNAGIESDGIAPKKVLSRSEIAKMVYNLVEKAEAL